MILFKPENVAPILAGEKTETRRLGKKRWNVGSTHLFYTRPPFVRVDPGDPFAKVLILDVHQEELGEIGDAGARREGYQNREVYLAAFDRINGKTSRETLVWVVRFELFLEPEERFGL